MHLPYIKNLQTFLPVICLVSCILLFAGCEGKENLDKTPNALHDKSIDVSLLSKRSGKDLLDNLYDELEDKSEELKGLEQEMEMLQKMKSDSVLLFTRYDNKSKTYYANALNHLQAIKDSVLRLRMKALIDKSMASYDSAIYQDKQLIAFLDSSHIGLQDMFNILKLVKTLPLIHKYQQDYLPADSMYRKLVEAYENSIKKVDSLAK